MSAKKKLMYICMNCAKVVDTKDQKRHTRNCTVNKSPGLYEEPDVVSSSEEENEMENKEQAEVQNEVQYEEQDQAQVETRIINAVHKRQPLWDNRMHKLERSAQILADLWSEVDKETGLPPGKAKTQWIVIRHRFSCERRRIESGRKTFWPHYTPLLFLIATRQPKQQSPVVLPKASTPKITVPKAVAPKVTVPKIFEPKKNKAETRRASNATSNSASYNQPLIKETHQFLPDPSKRGRTSRSNIEPLLALPPPPISINESRKRELSVTSSDSDVDVVEEINMNGSLMNPISYKRVCIQQMQTQLQNLDDDEDDEIRRFCSYLEVMLRKMPKSHQEMFCEETLDHLASVNRKLRRSNF